VNEDILNSSMRSTQSKNGLFDESADKMNIMSRPIGPIGGAPGRRESHYNSPQEILNSSMVTDKNKFKVIGHGMMANSSVISRASALAPSKHEEAKRETPRQFSNIDDLDKKDSRKKPEVPEAVKEDKKPELLIPPVLYKLNAHQSTL
jgi:hypothetical protein